MQNVNKSLKFTTVQLDLELCTTMQQNWLHLYCLLLKWGFFTHRCCFYKCVFVFNTASLYLRMLKSQYISCVCLCLCSSHCIHPVHRPGLLMLCVCVQGGVCGWRWDVQWDLARAGHQEPDWSRCGPEPTRRRPGAVLSAHRNHPCRWGFPVMPPRK